MGSDYINASFIDVSTSVIFSKAWIGICSISAFKALTPFSTLKWIIEKNAIEYLHNLIRTVRINDWEWLSSFDPNVMLFHISFSNRVTEKRANLLQLKVHIKIHSCFFRLLYEKKDEANILCNLYLLYVLSLIALTGPKPETVGDFWRMVWEQKSATIVMLTNTRERKEARVDIIRSH